MNTVLCRLCYKQTNNLTIFCVCIFLLQFTIVFTKKTLLPSWVALHYFCSIGTIEMSKMIEVLKTVYIMESSMSGNMARDKATQIFYALDIDGNGSLTCDEFINRCLKDEEIVKMFTQNNSLPSTDRERLKSC